MSREPERTAGSGAPACPSSATVRCTQSTQRSTESTGAFPNCVHRVRSRFPPGRPSRDSLDHRVHRGSQRSQRTRIEPFEVVPLDVTAHVPLSAGRIVLFAVNGSHSRPSVFLRILCVLGGYGLRAVVCTNAAREPWTAALDTIRECSRSGYSMRTHTAPRELRRSRHGEPPSRSSTRCCVSVGRVVSQNSAPCA